MKPAPKRGRLETALWMLKSGLSPVLTRPGEKRPIGTAWGLQTATREKLRDAFECTPGAGVGALLGEVSGVVDFEVDDEALAAELLDKLDLPPTVGWRSARGNHSLFLWDRRLEGVGKSVAHFPGSELRIGGEGRQVFSVCPPTIGDNRRRRRWHGHVWEIAPLPDALVDLLSRGSGVTPRCHYPPPVSNRYAAAALRDEVANVARAKPGTRNSALNKSAFCLSRFVPLGLLTREALEAALTEAAHAAGLDEPEIGRTLRSGIDAGLRRVGGS